MKRVGFGLAGWTLVSGSILATVNERIYVQHKSVFLSLVLGTAVLIIASALFQFAIHKKHHAQ